MRGIKTAAAVMAAMLGTLVPAAAYRADRQLLSVVAPLWEHRAGHDTASPRGMRRSRCDRLQTVIGRLGETYAGHRLRQTLTVRACAMFHHAVDEGIWSWPWATGVAQQPAAGHRMPDLPPHHHATLGAWEIRCSHVGARQRCALIRAEAAADGQSTGSIVSHFVIDAVAGREIVLWRVVVARPEIAAGAIAVNVAATTVHQSYSQCLDNGCIMESGVAISAKVASQLWHGAPVSIQLEASPGASVFVLPALGFREGLAELTRLRHDDRSFTVIRQAP